MLNHVAEPPDLPAMPAWLATHLGRAPVLTDHSRGRARRVVLLVVATVLISLADLYMTLLYATSVGLHEANPLARAVMLYNCPWVVVAFRLLTIGLFGLVLFRARHRPIAELASWLCVVTMVWLAFRWEAYNASAVELTGPMLLATGTEASEFIAIGRPE